jgi:hypothetical protein
VIGKADFSIGGLEASREAIQYFSIFDQNFKF